MRAFRLVDWDRHGHQTDGPATDDASNKKHGQVHSGTLQDTAHCCDQCSDLDCSLAAEPVLQVEQQVVRNVLAGALKSFFRTMVKPPINEPNTAPPENVELIAPIIGEVGTVLK